MHFLLFLEDLKEQVLIKLLSHTLKNTINLRLLYLIFYKYISFQIILAFAKSLYILDILKEMNNQKDKSNSQNLNKIKF